MSDTCSDATSLENLQYYTPINRSFASHAAALKCLKEKKKSAFLLPHVKVNLMDLFLTGCCLSQPCLHDGTCVEDASTGFRCNCHPEFSGPTCGIIQGGKQFKLFIKQNSRFFVT